MTDQQADDKKKKIQLCCGHFVPRSCINKFDDDLAWCARCKRWLATGHD